MKKLVLLLAITLSTSVFANNSKPVDAIKSELRTEIIKLLGNADFNLNNNLTTIVEFTVNNKGEVIVLSVNTNNKKVDRFVKSKLNYRTITNKAVVKGSIYKMPLKLVKKQ